MAPARTRRRALRRVLAVMAAAAFFWIAGVAAWIADYGGRDLAADADCAMVLGAAVRGDDPSPVFEERIRHGLHLHRTGRVPRLVFTGGIGDGHRRSESSVARDYAEKRGVPADAILIEERSRTTRQNLAEAAALMRARGLRSAIVVSDPLHMRRATLMARDLGIAALPSPTPTTRYTGWASKAKFLAREVYFLHHYWLTGD